MGLVGVRGSRPWGRKHRRQPFDALVLERRQSDQRIAATLEKQRTHARRTDPATAKCQRRTRERAGRPVAPGEPAPETATQGGRSEEHTSELQSLMRISYAVFCLKKKKSKKHDTTHKQQHASQH